MENAGRPWWISSRKDRRSQRQRWKARLLNRAHSLLFEMLSHSIFSQCDDWVSLLSFCGLVMAWTCCGVKKITWLKPFSLSPVRQRPSQYCPLFSMVCNTGRTVKDLVFPLSWWACQYHRDWWLAVLAHTSGERHLRTSNHLSESESATALFLMLVLKHGWTF